MGQEKKLSISAIQMCSKIGDKQANLEKVQGLVERDIKAGTDIIVLPEVWTVGWALETVQKILTTAEQLTFFQKLPENTKPGLLAEVL